MTREPRINVYQCQYNCLTTTVDVDKGVTPFMMKCKKKPTKERPIEAKYLGEDGECIGTAQSSFYPRGPMPKYIPVASHEWYAPSEEEQKNLHPAELEHVKNGGLLLRERTKKEALCHEK